MTVLNIKYTNIRDINRLVCAPVNNVRTTKIDMAKNINILRRINPATIYTIRVENRSKLFSIDTRKLCNFFRTKIQTPIPINIKETNLMISRTDTLKSFKDLA